MVWMSNLSSVGEPSVLHSSFTGSPENKKLQILMVPSVDLEVLVTL